MIDLKNIKVRLSLYLIGAIVLFFIIFLGGYGLIKLSTAQHRLEVNIRESNELIDAVDKARHAQVEFKIQVQEWKDMLLRGFEKQSFDRHLEGFKKSGENFQIELAELKKIAEDLKYNTTMIEHIQQDHLRIMQQYREAIKSFDPNDSISYRKVDLLVKGIDRDPTADMDSVVNGIQEYSHKMFNKMTAESKNEYNHAREFYIFVVIVVLIILSVVFWFVSSRIINTLTSSVNSMTSISTQIASTINEHERIAAQQSAAVNQTTTTTNELSSSSRLSAEQAEATGAGTAEALNEAEKGNSIVNEMLIGMEGLKSKVNSISHHIHGLSNLINEISGIAKLVTNFANETKMLAMNAAIEAVRAGIHGKGFSLLSVEIRKLAQESKASSENISLLVSSIIKSTDLSVSAASEGIDTVVQEMKLAHQTSEAFKNITYSINNTYENTKQITLNVKQQSIAINQIVEAMNSLNIGAKETASGITQTKVGITTLTDISNDLKKMI
ncbi:MAG: hypothetical protein HQK91_11555 [Nitrospirae bacterium]|nr:hypothetical protein [Nitrospirota bacterium]